jgi:hypothetical protein
MATAPRKVRIGAIFRVHLLALRNDLRIGASAIGPGERRGDSTVRIQSRSCSLRLEGDRRALLQAGQKAGENSLPVRGHAVGGHQGRGEFQARVLEECLGGSGLKRARREHDRDRDELALRGEVEELLSVASPFRGRAPAGGDLPLPARGREGPDVDLGRAGFVSDVGEKPSVGRERRTPLLGRGLRERKRTGVSRHWQDPDVPRLPGLALRVTQESPVRLMPGKPSAGAVSASRDLQSAEQAACRRSNPAGRASRPAGCFPVRRGRAILASLREWAAARPHPSRRPC